MTENKDTGKTVLEISTWGGKGTMELDQLFHQLLPGEEINGINYLGAVYLVDQGK